MKKYGENNYSGVIRSDRKDVRLFVGSGMDT